MKIVKNEYSAHANPRRGYHDYEWIAEFEGESLEARESIRDGKVADLKPSNMWVRVKEFNEKRIVINYGYDSGD